MVPVLGGLPQFVISPDPKFWGLPQENHLQMVGFESLFLHHARFESLLQDMVKVKHALMRQTKSRLIGKKSQPGVPLNSDRSSNMGFFLGNQFGREIWPRRPTATNSNLFFLATSFYLCESHQGRLFVGEVTLRNVSYISQSISTYSQRWLPCPMFTKLFIPIYSHIWW